MFHAFLLIDTYVKFIFYTVLQHLSNTIAIIFDPNISVYKNYVHKNLDIVNRYACTSFKIK